MHPARMNLIESKSKSKSTHLGLISLSLLAVSCSMTTINTDQYQGETATEQTNNGPVAELHRLAISALDQQQYNQSVNYLQRAIKIEPRNAHSWHYLAQSYWQMENYPQCLDMVQRSYSYSNAADHLDRANDVLKTQCLAN
jgi:cytochrome c-type biogenesis protein CcmH/NrfG